MLPGGGSPRVFSRLAGVLIAIFVLQCFFASRLKSPVFDETGDIAAGLSYLKTGEVRANLQHPPLLKEIGALPLLALGTRWPDSPEARQLLAGAGVERQVGSALIAANGPDSVMFWSRLPFILMAAGLGVLIYVWGRELVGDLAALGALFLYALDPNIVAHAYLVTTDSGFAAFAVLFLFTLWNYIKRPGWTRLLFCGLALGAALATKFTAVFLLPIAGILLFAQLSLAALRRPPPSTAGASPFLNPGAALLAMGLLATLLIQALYASPGGLFLYSTGLQRINADHNPDYMVFMAGELQPRFASYFLVAWLLKEPLAAIVLCVLGLAALLRMKTIEMMSKFFLILPPAVLFAAYTMWADNLGFRYIIPVLPFLYLIGGLGLAMLIRNRAKWGRVTAALLCCWMLVAAAGIYPDHLSYFNEIAALLRNSGTGQSACRIGLDGGTRCGTLWLDDSNVDWGQGLKQLKTWMDQHPARRTIHLAYFGSFPPEAYGISARPIDIGGLMPDPAPGVYVISAHFVARIPALAEADKASPSHWLRRTTPTAIIGHSFYIYDIPGPG